ncbi:ABC transporter ATP-binding protein [Blautia producta]|uniref:ABC-type quaternary amine transporter n=1 Tax=Blautia producta TaxID=33035 RepID=A0A4P6M2G0_9FIRM|nr:ABC transporter ATP-binding protein [Blautia producta]QBE98255.1 Choline transport ATP-binding protein OpuBA [Blautia producta]
MIEYRNVRKYYGDQLIIQDINMKVEDGEFVVIIGPSGCGKTTAIKMLNRLLETSDGNILINGIDNKEMDLIQLRTMIGYVIQQIGLFPNMTVEENISVVPQILKWNKEKTKERVKELLSMVNMPYDSYAKKYPRQLSGGQQQRIGVLRAMAVNPPIIIMDEPFGALDPITREILQNEVKKIQKNLHITVLFITHDMHEAMKLADRIVFMDQGKILQTASPKEMVLHPANETVAQFIRLQEVEAKKEQTSAKDLMQPLAGPVESARAVFVRETDSLETIGRHYDLSDNRKIYVQNQSGSVVGEITVESLILNSIKQV